MTVARLTPSGLGAELPSTLAQALERAAFDRAAGVRFLDRRERATWAPWAEIRERALEIAGGLARLGLAPGDRVGLVYPTSRELLDAFFGVVLAGGLPACLPPPPRFGKREVFETRTASMLEAIGADLVLAEARLIKRFGPSILAGRRCLVQAELPAGWEVPAAEPDPNALAMIQFSSGTTLEPKPVALSNASVVAQARLLNSFWPDSPGRVQRGLSWLPLYHDMGLIGCVFVSLERPGELTLLPPEVFAARPAIWLRAISNYQITVSPGTNFAYGYCTDQIRDDQIEGVDLSTWEVALNGAEPVIGDVMRGFSERFARWGFDAKALTPVYGLAEATLAVTFSDIGEGFKSARFARESLNGDGRVVEAPDGREVVSVGRPVSGFEVSIRDAERQEVPPGEVGHIWARGSTVMEGYLGLPEATREVLRNGWLDTGDLGFLHHGELYVCGRAKELIIVRGKNHSPVEIEQAAESAAGVQSSGAVAVSHICDDSGREQVLLFVERERRLPPETQEGIPGACHAAVLTEAGVDVDQVVVLPPESIPRTSSGKVRRRETLRRSLRGELGSR